MDKQIIEQDLKQYAAIESLKDSEGGKILIQGLRKDIMSLIEEIAMSSKSTDLSKFVALSASLSARLSFLNALTNSTENKRLAKEELERILDL